jgi:hypothetical protein
MAALIKNDPARRRERRPWNYDNAWAFLKSQFRELPEARRMACIEVLSDIHADQCKAEAKEPAKPAQETLPL